MEVLRIENLRAYYVTSLYGVERRVRAVDNVNLEVLFLVLLENRVVVKVLSLRL